MRLLATCHIDRNKLNTGNMNCFMYRLSRYARILVRLRSRPRPIYCAACNGILSGWRGPGAAPRGASSAVLYDYDLFIHCNVGTRKAQRRIHAVARRLCRRSSPRFPLSFLPGFLSNREPQPKSAKADSLLNNTLFLKLVINKLTDPINDERYTVIYDKMITLRSNNAAIGTQFGEYLAQWGGTAQGSTTGTGILQVICTQLYQSQVESAAFHPPPATDKYSGVFRSSPWVT
jgi:hypothetical protein